MGDSGHRQELLRALLAGLVMAIGALLAAGAAAETASAAGPAPQLSQVRVAYALNVPLQGRAVVPGVEPRGVALDFGAVPGSGSGRRVSSAYRGSRRARVYSAPRTVAQRPVRSSIARRYGDQRLRRSRLYSHRRAYRGARYRWR